MSGAVDGTFELVLPTGVTQVTGQFVGGRRSGLFVFYVSSGAKSAELPYEADVLHGTARLWYTTNPGAGELKLESRYAHGRLDGETSAWYPGGARHEFSIYESGVLKETGAWTLDGRPLPQNEAIAAAGTLRDADRHYFDVLAGVVQDNLPTCTP